jgi:alpha-tubulin suppressor-like RCC1 family protein
VRELLPKPVEALRGVRVGSIAAAKFRSNEVVDTGEVWAWGMGETDDTDVAPLGHFGQRDCLAPRMIQLFQGIEVDVVAACHYHTLALAGEGSVYVWDNIEAAEAGALGLGPSVCDAGQLVPTPRRISALHVACGL